MADGAEFDIVIIGGGMVGASLACALGATARRVALVEAQAATGGGAGGLDRRSIALAEGTRRIFEGLGVWQDVAGHAAPIRQVHISDRGRFGATRLRAADYGFDALGYVADIAQLSRTVADHAASQRNVELLCPAQLQQLSVQPDHVELRLEVDGRERALRARLVVAADGARSVVRESLDIGVTRWDYDQTAVIANVETALAHRDTAYERFTDTGPIALLPLPGEAAPSHRSGVVWTVRSARVEQIMALDDDQFRAAIQERFGHRLGAFAAVGARQCFPLAMTRAREHVRPRVALIGNAAHTLHPVAGQGFNLGIRDVAVLAELLAETSGDPGDWQLLQRYAHWRERDQRLMIAFTDGLARVFSNPLPGVGLLRDIGLLAVDMVPPLKRMLLRQTMGMAGRAPRLVRGLGLTPPSLIESES